MKNQRPTLAERLSQHAESFTQSDRLIADYLLRTYTSCLFQNASAIAEDLQINVSTVTRFFPKIGYSNLKQAWADFRKDLQFLADSPLTRFRTLRADNPETTQNLMQAMELDWSNIQKTMSAVNPESVELFLDLMSDQKRGVYFLGMRKEFALAYYFSNQLVGLRNNTYLIQSSSVVDQLSNLQSNDVLVVFDFRRYSNIHTKACNYAKSIGAKLVVFADSAISPSAGMADCLFLVHTQGVSAYDSYTAGMTLINSLLGIMISSNAQQFEDKYGRLEKLKHHMEVFTFHEESVSLDQGYKKK